MQKRSEVCKRCQHAAICFGLGLHVVLQTIADMRAGWEGAAVNEKVWQEDLETSAWGALRRNLPDSCPEYKEGDWYVCFAKDGSIEILRAETLKPAKREGDGYRLL